MSSPQATSLFYTGTALTFLCEPSHSGGFFECAQRHTQKSFGSVPSAFEMGFGLNVVPFAALCALCEPSQKGKFALCRRVAVMVVVVVVGADRVWAAAARKRASASNLLRARAAHSPGRTCTCTWSRPPPA